MKKRRAQRRTFIVSRPPTVNALGSGSWSTYDAAQFSPDRTIRSWVPADSRSTLTKATRSMMCGLARDAYNNIGLAKGLVDGIARRVGSPIPQSLARDEVWAQESEEAFLETAKILDRSRKLDYSGICAMHIKRDLVDGDLGTVLLDSAFPQLAFVESHRITATGKESPDIVDGVQVNKQGTPLNYFVRTEDDNSIPIPARDFILTFKPAGRADQVRGVTEFHAALTHLHDLFHDIYREEILAVKEAGAIGLTVKGGAAKQLFGRLSKDKNGSVTMEPVRAGAMLKLGAGEEVQSFQSNRPSPTFAGFSELIIRDICCSIGWPIEFVYGTAGQGTAERKVLQQAQWVVDEWSAILENQFLTRLWGWVISKLIKSKKLGRNPDWWRVAYLRSAKMTVDVGRESQQRRQNILLGIESENDWASDTGKHFTATRRQIMRERRYTLTQAKELLKEFPELGTIQGALELLRQTGPNPSAQNIKTAVEETTEPAKPDDKETPADD